MSILRAVNLWASLQFFALRFDSSALSNHSPPRVPHTSQYKVEQFRDDPETLSWFRNMRLQPNGSCDIDVDYFHITDF